MGIQAVVEYLYPARFCILVLILSVFLMVLFFKRGFRGSSGLTRLFVSALVTLVIAVSVQTVMMIMGKDGVEPVQAGIFIFLVKTGTVLQIMLTCMLSVYMNAIAYENDAKTRRFDICLKIIWSILFFIAFILAIVRPVTIPEGTDVVGAEREYYYILVWYLLAYLLNQLMNMIIRWKQSSEDEKYYYMMNMFVAAYTVFAIHYVSRTMSGVFFDVMIVLSAYLFIENLDKKEKEKYLKDKLTADLANSAKSSFLSNISHEIRTPLNAIIGINEMIRRDYDDPDLMDYTTDINNASHTLLGIVNNLLDLGKIENGKIDKMECEFDLADVLNEVCLYTKTRVEAKGLDFNEIIDPGVPGILFGDAGKLRQIVSNLGTNAVKYTEKGNVTLKVEYERMKDVPGVYLIISVSDTGRGIREEDLPRLFNKFERFDVKDNVMIEGAGLGMSIVAQYLDILGGQIDIKSKYGRGSTFIVKIPFVVVDETPMKDLRSLRKPESETEKTGNYDFSGKDIMVVDDSLINLKVFEGLLKKTGANVVCLTGGKAALEEVKKTHYDVIFLDHMMPEMDGMETLKQMKRLEQMGQNKCARTPVVALTANALAGARDEYISSGFTNYLSKPVDVKLLFEMIDGYVNGEAAGGA